MAKDSKKEKRKVRFEPGNIEITVEQGANLLDAALQAGVRLTASCGGAGVCGTCKVIIEEGEVTSTRTDKVTDSEYKRGIRQACKSKIISDLKVRIPVGSRLETAVVAREKKGFAGVKVPTVTAKGWRFSPPITRYYLELPPPTLQDNVSDLSRVLRGLTQQHNPRNLAVDFDVVRRLSRTLRDGKWKTTVTLLTTEEYQPAKNRGLKLINVEPGDTTGKHFSLAIDVGTTTVCAQMLDLNKGKVISESMEYNGQIRYGADVVTRIAYCEKPGGLEKLQTAVVDTINLVIQQLVGRKRIRKEDIGLVIAAGNTTMIQILLGLDPRHIRLAPYTPVATYLPPVKASSLGINVTDHVYLFSFPQVSSYVGGDIVSGIVASGVYQREKLTFYMDIGTNGEIVIGNSEWMVTAACSAGPAFEGGGVKHGMLATGGAIEEFDINTTDYEPIIGTIGREKPKGICGSGLISIVAGLLKAGVIAQNGKFNTDLPTKRVREGSDGYEYVLAYASKTQTGEDIVITEADIDSLLRAKAAMYAGCQTLVESVGLTCRDIEQVIIAGAFGSHIDIEKAITIGLLPDLPRDRFIFIGNGSLMGARLSSFSTDILDDARKVAGLMTNFELSENVAFMNNYIAALFLPHTNAGEFPTVAIKASNRLKGRAGY